MSRVVVLTFDDPEEAGQLRETLRGLEKQGRLSLDDAAVVVKDRAGEVKVHGQLDRGVKYGAIGGAILGPLLMFMFPVAGIAVGAAAGAGIGASVGMGVEKQFVQDVSAALTPGSSALFLNVAEADRSAALAALQGHKGHVYQTSLSSEAEDELRAALGEAPKPPGWG
jgi:uncharacterized membrane protein